MKLEQMSAEACYQQAVALREKGEARRAAQMLQVAILKDPANPRFKRMRSELRGDAAAQPRTLAPSERAQKNTGRARSALAMGRYDEALGILRHLAKDDPTNVEHPLALGTLLLRRDRSEEAIGYARRACQLEPERLDCHLLMMEVYLHFGPASAADSERRKVRHLARGSREDRTLAEESLDGIYAAPRRLELVPPRGQRRRFSLLVGLLALTGALYAQYAPKAPVPIDAAAFAAVVPATAARGLQEEMQLALTLEGAVWERIPLEERRDHLEAALSIGRALGYESLRIEDEAGMSLGWANHERVYLRTEDSWQDPKLRAQARATGSKMNVTSGLKEAEEGASDGEAPAGEEPAPEGGGDAAEGGPEGEAP